MAKLSIENLIVNVKARHINDVREQLAQALHKNSHWDNTKSWEKPKPGLKEEFYMSEKAKEDWRWMADRFTNEIAPKFGIKVIKD
jgi:small-conductance mechanosensitive channel